MNLKLRRPLLGMIAALAVAGGAVGVAASLETVADPALAANEVSALASTATTVEMSSFSATSGSLDAVVSYETGKGGGTSAPAIINNDGIIRLYQNKNGTGGGFITVKAADGYLLSEVKIGSSMTTTIRYTVDDGAESANESLSANGIFDLSGISAQSVTFTCYGTSSSTRLYVNYLSATYASSTPAADDEKATSLTLSLGSGQETIGKGEELDPTGYEVTLNYTSESDELYSRQEPIDPADERLTWNYDSSTLGPTDLTVTFRDGDVELTSNAIQIDVSAATEYRFGEHEDFLTIWSSSYEERILTFVDSGGEQLFEARFSSANKQSGTITDMPVSKGGTLTIASSKDMLGIVFGFRQWPDKTQDVTLTVGTHSEEISFPSDGTSIAYVGETSFKEAVVTMSNNSNQIGWEYVSITWAPEASSDASAFAEAFLEEPLCDGGVTAPDVEAWDTLAALYEETLTEEDKAFFASAVPDEEGTLVEQCVARYDYIVGKYGSDVYQDFMGRTPEPLNYGLDVRSQMPEGTTAWICAASLIAATAVLGGAFIVKRRRESR